MRGTTEKGYKYVKKIPWPKGIDIKTRDPKTGFIQTKFF